MHTREDRARGLVLGLLLGDAIGAGHPPEGTLRATCLGQLACFTVEGLIRAEVRGRRRGICHPPTMAWRAWRRWAQLQGIELPGPVHDSDREGWLIGAGVLGERRGDAPVTVRALRAAGPDPASAENDRAGHHALTRVLPAALLHGGERARALAAALAATTHGHPEAAAAAGLGATAAAAALDGAGDLASLAAEADGLELGDAPGTAPHALLHAARAAAAAEGFADLAARAREHGPGALTAAAALFGAVHGVLALPQPDLARLDLAWLADTLTRDALALHAVADDDWPARLDWDRYPGA